MIYKYPKPIPAQEQLMLFERAKNGDQEARDRLILSCVPLLAKQISQWNIDKNLQQDLLQEGISWMAVRIDKFDPSRGTKLSSFLLVNAIFRMKRVIYRLSPVHVSYKAYQKGIKPDRVMLTDIPVKLSCNRNPPIYDILIRRVRDKFVDDLLGSLDSEYERITRLRFGIGCYKHNYKELGELYGLTHGEICNFLRRAMHQLRKRFRRFRHYVFEDFLVNNEPPDSERVIEEN